MCIKKMMEGMLKKMKWYDISLIKMSTLSATLFLITVWPALHDLVMRVDWYWYLIVMVIFMCPLIDRMLFCRCR